MLTLLIALDHSMDKREESLTNSGSILLDTVPTSKVEELLIDASSLHAKMLEFSNALNSVISERKEIDAECSRLAAFQP
ncbi:hypothetical protein RB195_000689 [Necator americanus]|uniref:Uncharacterized protein n=1 Tax=Necator americanus TaxID=51031 RepID=A0ABR1DC96_NECAM